MATIRHLNQIELAARWNISHRTLERWRWTGEGPRFMKMGGRVVYRIEDIKAFEVEQLRKSTAEQPHDTPEADEVLIAAPLIERGA